MQLSLEIGEDNLDKFSELEINIQQHGAPAHYDDAVKRYLENDDNTLIH